MNSKDLIIKQTENAMNAFFNYARGVPEDKLNWVALGEARSVLSQAQECAQSPGWGKTLLENKVFGGMDETVMQAMRDERSQWTTVEQCEAVCRERAAKLFDAIRAFPDDEMEDTIELPFGKKTFFFWEIMLLHNWNCTYHLGQVAYIQTLYGDMGYY